MYIVMIRELIELYMPCIRILLRINLCVIRLLRCKDVLLFILYEINIRIKALDS